jgi:hypothetical protein
MAELSRIETCRKKLSYLKSKRESHNRLFRDLSDYIAPDRGFFEGEVAGQERTDRYKRLIDPTATISLDYFAAGMQSGMNSPKRLWFNLQTDDSALNKFAPVKEYFDEAEKILYGILGKTNFYTASHNVYLEEGTFGTGCLLMEPDFEKIVRFTALTAGEYWIDTGINGKVDTLYREVYMTVKNMVDRWGKGRVTDKIRQAYENNNLFTLFKVIHVVEPRAVRDVTRIDTRNMKYASIYFEEDAQDVLGESGFDYCPIAAPRWNVVGSAVYGTGPGHKILRQVKMLQEMNLTKLKAEHLRVDPPTIAPESLKNKGMNTLPGGRNYLDQDKIGQYGPLFNVNYDPSGTIEGIQDVRHIIERCLYTDLFIMLVEKDDMTATEVLERKQEKLFTLGPAIEKQTDELHDPVIDFVYNEAGRRGKLPPAPEELMDQEYKTEYISSLAQAQKLAGLEQTRAYVAVGIELAQLGEQAAQEVMDKIDIAAIMDTAADITGIAPRCNRSEEDVAEIRGQREQQQQAMLADAQAGEQAQRMKTLSDASMEGPNALTQLQEAMGG